MQIENIHIHLCISFTRTSTRLVFLTDWVQRKLLCGSSKFSPAFLLDNQLACTCSCSSLFKPKLETIKLEINTFGLICLDNTQTTDYSRTQPVINEGGKAHHIFIFLRTQITSQFTVNSYEHNVFSSGIVYILFKSNLHYFIRILCNVML